MEESTEPVSISFKPTKITLKQGKSDSSTYIKKTILKNDSDEDIEEGIRDELLAGYDLSGALSLNPEKETKKSPLVIPVLKNKDWKEEALKRLEKISYLTCKKALEAGDSSFSDKTEENKKTYGLTFADSKKDILSQETAEKLPSSPLVISKEETEEESAIKALLAEAKGEKTESNLVLPMTTSDTDWKKKIRSLTEDELYRLDIASLPNPATLEDYENVPVEEFGNALLRGMGWKEGEGIGKNKKSDIMPIEVVKRAQFLGIGAKEYDAEEQDELGAWGKGITKKRIDKTYIPVLKVSKITGKVIYDSETTNESKEFHEKKSFTESPDKSKNASKKYNHNYSHKEYRSKSRNKHYEEDNHYSSIKKDSNGYKHRHSRSEEKNEYYNTHRDRR